ncbi:MAG: class I SAM-dependent methyltransferase [Lysobacteraceae bacterium]
MPKPYDAAYFDHWYRADDQRKGRRALLTRKVALAVAMAEYHLQRPLRSVLDVGCGEGVWRAPLLALRPKLAYMGVDASEYAVARFGRRRNLKHVRFSQLAELRFGAPVDLLVCSDVLHYLSAREVQQGLSGFSELCDGVGYFEVFCRGDDVVGDVQGFCPRSADFYRRAFARAGFSACGSHCYLSPALADEATALEVSANPAALR